ncbi:hypothetical protein LIER_40950 [Lithospermum erythrorhizon]|uniref:DC1 domain-containing protein n=1 Tax=Lithospermum erythrorhizon TaxID=34254 RepID=A0AAV3R258_LITER
MEIIKDKFTDVELLRNDETTISKTCFGCHEEIESHSLYYVYKARAFKMKRVWHKFFLELPTEMEHPLHPLHLLRLDWLDVHCCDFCKRSGGWQWMYACSTCKFYVCLMCGGDATLKVFSSKSPEERETMKLKYG